MAKPSTGRVVVRRKRTYGEGHIGGSWKIAYADFMTAMMAFFLVMWLLLLVPRDELKGIAEYFRTPLMTAVTGGEQVSSSQSIIPGGQPSVIPNTSPLSPDASVQDDEDAIDQANLEDLKAQLENLIEQSPVLKQFRPQLLLDMTPDGLRIQILDQKNRPMFATGSALVQPYMRDILRELAPPINQLPNSITISGHTDAMQYALGTRSYSNWELSADRANAARRELVAGGLLEQKVKRILGLGETVNLIKDNPMAAVNRRISVLVLNRRAERRIDRQNAAGADSTRIQELLQNPDLFEENPEEATSGITSSGSETPSAAISQEPDGPVETATSGPVPAAETPLAGNAAAADDNQSTDASAATNAPTRDN